MTTEEPGTQNDISCKNYFSKVIAASYKWPMLIYGKPLKLWLMDVPVLVLNGQLTVCSMANHLNY